MRKPALTMRSLRVQLVLGTALGTALVLWTSGVALHALIDRTLRAEFDRALAAKARALAALIEFDDEGLESELLGAPLPEFAAAQQGEYYEIWRADGGVFGRSPSLNAGDLPRSAGDADQPTFGNTRLPDGRPGRCVQLQVVPRHEPEFRAAAIAATVTLAVARETGSLEAVLARLGALLVAVGVCAVSLSALVLAWLVHRNMQPVTRLSGQIAEVGERELSKRIAGQAVPRELSPIVDRLNDLLSRVEAAFARERQFTGDVAHELRTPLAGLRGKLELALSRDRAPEDYRDMMQDCLTINLRMQRLIENLLQLARADAGQLELRRAPVDFAALTLSCWEPLEQRAAARGLRVEWRVTASEPVESDTDALRLVIRNLLDNAVTYATENGRLTVSLSQDDGCVVVDVRNTSSLAAEDAQRVFERFWRADASRQQRDERHGLGLPLCQALVEGLGGTITATVTGDTFRVVVRLPASRG